MRKNGPDERFMLRKSSFYANLLGATSYGSREILLRDAGDLGLTMHKRFHRIIVAEVELWENFYTRGAREYDPDLKAEVFFVLSNAGLDLFHMEQRCHVDVTDFQGRIIFWIDSDTDTIAESAFQSAARDIIRVLEEEYRLFVTFSIGTWFHDLFQSFWSYMDTLNMLFYGRYLEIPGAVYIAEQLPTTAPSITLEQRVRQDSLLLDAISVRNYETVRDMIRQLFQQRFYDHGFPMDRLPQQRAAFSELLEAAVNQMVQGTDIPESFVAQIVETIYSAETAQAQLAAVSDCMDEVMNRQESDPLPECPPWIHRLKEYVLSNYADQNLTVYALADMVHVTPSYCTRMFRRHTGMSLLEFLQRTRAQAAIRLMSSGGTMAEVARKTGFSCTQTMRRTLKQYA